MVFRIIFVFCLCLCFLEGCAPARDVSTKQSILPLPWHPLRSIQHLDVLVKAIGDRRIVLLGESTHGTHEFYQWRAALTRKLIEEKGFSFVGLEGDWVDTHKVNMYVNGPPSDSSAGVAAVMQYDRWPYWMWGNHDFAGFVYWLHQYNRQHTGKVSVHGLDVYSFWEWIQPETVYPDSSIAAAARMVAACFAAYNNDALKYAGAVQLKKADCRTSTERLWQAVQSYLAGKRTRTEADHLLEQHALLAWNGERYFRTMVSNRAASWNIRDGHMAQTVSRLLQQLGKNSKAIIWAHNGHVGDARYSEMSTAGYSSMGEMLRRQFPGQTFSVGFGTYQGTVAAGYQWNAPIQMVKIPPAKAGSWEALLHEMDSTNKIIISSEIEKDARFQKWIEFRAIGAVFGEWAVYGRSVIPKRFDAFVYVDTTTPIKPVR